MKCPNCEYDGNEGWAHEDLTGHEDVRPGGTRGYYCPKCFCYFVVDLSCTLAPAFEDWVREIVRVELEQAIKNWRNGTKIRGDAL